MWNYTVEMDVNLYLAHSVPPKHLVSVLSERLVSARGRLLWVRLFACSSSRIGRPTPN